MLIVNHYNFDSKKPCYPNFDVVKEYCGLESVV